MSETCYARIMSRGQLTIPKAIRDVLGVKSGDCIAFVVENGTVRIVSSDDYAFQQFQAQMAGNDPSSIRWMKRPLKPGVRDWCGHRKPHARHLDAPLCPFAVRNRWKG